MILSVTGKLQTIFVERQANILPTKLIMVPLVQHLLAKRIIEQGVTCKRLPTEMTCKRSRKKNSKMQLKVKEVHNAKASRRTRLQTKNGKMPLAIFRERYAVVVRDSILPNDVSIFSQRKPLRNGPLNRISKN